MVKIWHFIRHFPFAVKFVLSKKFDIKHWKNMVKTHQESVDYHTRKIEQRYQKNKHTKSHPNQLAERQYLLEDAIKALAKHEQYQPNISEVIMDRVNGYHMIGPRRTQMLTYPYPDRLPIFLRDNGILPNISESNDSEYITIVNNIFPGK